MFIIKVFQINSDTLAKSVYTRKYNNMITYPTRFSVLSMPTNPYRRTLILSVRRGREMFAVVSSLQMISNK